MPEIACRCGSDVPMHPDKLRSTCEACGTTYDLKTMSVIPGSGDDGASATSERARAAQATGKQAERDTIEFYRRLGCVVYETSQYGKPKGMSPGIPDLLVFAGHCSRAPTGFWFHEVKGGENPRQSDAQQEFEAHADAAGVPYVLGDARAGAVFLGLIPQEGAGE